MTALYGISRKTKKRRTTICRRRSDGTLWAASSPQNFGLAMSGLFNGKTGWHFAKVRQWRGRTIVSPKTFWAFTEKGQFDLLGEWDALWLEPWTESVESAKIKEAEQ